MKKNFPLYGIALALLCAFGCEPHEVRNKPVELAYMAINGADTAWLHLSMGKESFKGKCKINYHNNYIDSGDVRGIIKGDTLLGDFHYLHYGLRWKRIAIAFLKKNDQLMMGEATQTVYLDIPFFAKDTPIKYDSVKFVFWKIKPNKTP